MHKLHAIFLNLTSGKSGDRRDVLPVTLAGRECRSESYPGLTSRAIVFRLCEAGSFVAVKKLPPSFGFPLDYIRAFGEKQGRLVRGQKQPLSPMNPGPGLQA